jgi:plastocyanin
MNQHGDSPSEKGVQMKRLTVLLLACALAAFGVAACGDDNNDNNDSTAATTGTTGSTGASGASGATGASSNGGGGGTIKVAADPSGALKFTTTKLTATAGKNKVAFTNDSPVPHNVSIEKGENEVGKTKVVSNGNASTTVTLKAGKYTYYCEVDGHEQAGMKGTLTVK